MNKTVTASARTPPAIHMTHCTRMRIKILCAVKRLALPGKTPAQTRSNRSATIALACMPEKPQYIPPMTARLVKQLPEGPEWLYEVKWDGYRLEAIKQRDSVRLVSRNAKDLTATFPDVCDALISLRAETAVIDGEVVAVNEQGKQSFQALQHRALLKGRIAYYAFDLLYLNGEDLRRLPLVDRRRKLERILRGSGVLFSAELDSELDVITEAVKSAGLEGIIAKRRDSRYESGERSVSWLKIQFKRQQEFVIGGYRPEGSSFGSILVGYYDGKKLVFAGKVRGGFNRYVREQLLKTMKPLETGVNPFANLPSTKSGHWGEGISAEEMRELKWVKPKLIAQVRFTEWTRDGHLRHADFLGLRTDKKPREVVRETPS